jgi:hypothetical protein
MATKAAAAANEDLVAVPIQTREEVNRVITLALEREPIMGLLTLPRSATYAFVYHWTNAGEEVNTGARNLARELESGR